LQRIGAPQFGRICRTPESGSRIWCRIVELESREAVFGAEFGKGFGSSEFLAKFYVRD
jgi:hypothetical protein